MVTHHIQDGHQPSKIYQKDVYHRLRIWHLDLTNKIKTSFQSMITHLSLDGHTSSLEWSPILQYIVTHFPKDYQPAFNEWSPTILSMVTNYPK